jgi:hypothetical protein
VSARETLQKLLRPAGPTRFVLVALLLGGVCASYARWALSQQQGWRWCLEDPKGRDGSTLLFPLWTVTAIEGPQRYRISKVVTGIPVEGATEGLSIGDTISVSARFDGPRSVAVETDRELHPLRRWKEGLGILGFLIVATCAPLGFRLRRLPEGRRLEERWRI